MQKSRWAQIIIAKDDHVRLTETAQRATQEDHRLAVLLLRKLQEATLFEPNELPNDVVPMDAFIRYRLDGGKVETRALIYPDDHMWPEAELSVMTPLGIALIGASAGERIPLRGAAEGAPRWVQVESVGCRLQPGLLPVMLRGAAWV
jgi:regulator of nucleoside diphosphate kinase